MSVQFLTRYTTRMSFCVQAFRVAPAIVGALAIFLLNWSTPVFGWTVQLYGGADVGLSYVSVSRGSLAGDTGARSADISMDYNVLSNSMFGIKGREDLGQGWQATFNLASEIDIANGQLALPAYFGIESTMGINHRDWGSLKLGRQTTVSTNFFGNIDPMQLSFGQANMGTSFTAINTQYYNNLVQYQSATWADFTFGAGYSFNTGDTAIYADSSNPQAVPSSSGFGTMNQMRALTAAVQYQHGPLLAVASYDTAWGSSTIQSANGQGRIPNDNLSNPQAWYLGAAYTLGKVVVSGAWGRGINGALSGSGPGSGVSGSPLPSLTRNGDILFAKGFNHNSYLLGFSWQIDDRTQLMASWQMLKPDGELAAVAQAASQQIVGAALTYNLSPRTTVYIWGSYGKGFQMVDGAKTSVIGTGFQTLF